MSGTNHGANFYLFTFYHLDFNFVLAKKQFFMTYTFLNFQPLAWFKVQKFAEVTDFALDFKCGSRISAMNTLVGHTELFTVLLSLQITHYTVHVEQ